MPTESTFCLSHQAQICPAIFFVFEQLAFQQERLSSRICSLFQYWLFSSQYHF